MHVVPPLSNLWQGFWACQQEKKKHFKTEKLETLDKFNPNQGGNEDRGTTNKNKVSCNSNVLRKKTAIKRFQVPFNKML